MDPLPLGRRGGGGTFDPSPRIAYGHQAERNQFPWIASLQRAFDGQDRHVCGGSLILNNLILTAAHCLYNSAGKFQPPTKVLIGATTISGSSNAREAFAVVNVFWPSAYDQGYWNDGAAPHDIAIVHFKGSSRTRPISLATKEPPFGVNITAAGWGFDNTVATTKSFPTQLMFTTMYLGASGKSPCPIMNNGTLCTAGKSVGRGRYPSTCQGDSGGPNILTNTTTLVAVTSFGPGTPRDCGTNPYQGITSVAAYYNSFIKPLMDRVVV